MLSADSQSTSSPGQMEWNVPPVSAPTITSLHLKPLLAAAQKPARANGHQ